MGWRVVFASGTGSFMVDLSLPRTPERPPYPG